MIEGLVEERKGLETIDRRKEEYEAEAEVLVMTGMEADNGGGRWGRWSTTYDSSCVRR